MLNQPIETGMTAGEEFAQNVLGRMNRTHEQFVELNQTLGAPSAADALLGEIVGLGQRTSTTPRSSLGLELNTRMMPWVD